MRTARPLAYAPKIDRTTVRGLRSWRRVPVSVAVVAAMTLLSAMSALPGSAHAVASGLGRYHAADLAAGRWWRLPASALLAQSVPQWAWTATVGVAVFAGLEVTVGSLRSGVVLAAGHLLPTLVVAAWAFTTADRELQQTPDYGTSCMIMAAASALCWRRRSAALLLGLLVIMSADLSINGPLTVIEHVISMATGILLVTTAGEARAVGRLLRQVPTRATSLLGAPLDVVTATRRPRAPRVRTRAIAAHGSDSRLHPSVELTPSSLGAAGPRLQRAAPARSGPRLRTPRRRPQLRSGQPRPAIDVTQASFPSRSASTHQVGAWSLTR